MGTYRMIWSEKEGLLRRKSPKRNGGEGATTTNPPPHRALKPKPATERKAKGGRPIGKRETFVWDNNFDHYNCAHDQKRGVTRVPYSKNYEVECTFSSQRPMTRTPASKR